MSTRGVRYRPAPFPQRFDESLLPWLYKELSRIGNLVAADRYLFPPLAAEPEKYEVGTTVYADGSNWDPGSGDGIYVWDGTQWLYALNTGGTGGTDDHSLLINRNLADQHQISAITGLQAALDAKEDWLGNPIADGYLLQSTASGTRSWLDPSTLGGGTSDHSLLTNRSLADQHPISAITGLQTALDARVVGPASATDENIALFDGTTGKLIQDSGVKISDLGGTTVHGDLTGRDASDQHPISAITGLQAALDAKEDWLNNPAADGYMLVSTAAGVRSWVEASIACSCPNVYVQDTEPVGAALGSIWVTLT